MFKNCLCFVHSSNEFKLLLLDVFIDKSRIDSGESYNKHSRKLYELISNSNIVHVFSFDFDRIFYSFWLKNRSCTVFILFYVRWQYTPVGSSSTTSCKPTTTEEEVSADWPSFIATQYVAVIAGQAVQNKATRGQFLICCVQERLL